MLRTNTQTRSLRREHRRQLRPGCSLFGADQPPPYAVKPRNPKLNPNSHQR